jgi:hypothetical protein
MSQFYVYLMIVSTMSRVFSFVVGCGGHFKRTGYFKCTVRKIGRGRVWCWIDFSPVESWIFLFVHILILIPVNVLVACPLKTSGFAR